MIGESSGLKVLFILPEFSPDIGGGIATYYNNLIQAFQKAGIEFSIYTYEETQSKGRITLDKKTTTTINLELYQSYKAKLRKLDLNPGIQSDIAKAWTLYEQTNQGDGFDIIETTDWGYGYLPWVLNSSKPVIVRLHGSRAQIETEDPKNNFAFWASLLRNLETCTIPMASASLTHSEDNIEYWKNRIGLESYYIPPVFSPSAITSNVQNTAISQEKFGLVVGRIQYWKGPETLCKALKYASIDFPIYWIGGDKEYQLKGQSYDRWLKKTYPDIWGEKIIPLGRKSYAETQEYMRRAAFGIVPSIWDMFNFTTLEWMFHGKPVICSKGAGSWRLVQQANGGEVFENRSFNQLASLLNCWAMLSDEELNHIGIIGQKNINTILNADKLIKQNISLYTDLIRNSNIKNISYNKWKFGLWMPDDETSNRMTTLENWPIREISKYIMKRLLGKIKRN